MLSACSSASHIYILMISPYGHHISMYKPKIPHPPNSCKSPLTSVYMTQLPATHVDHPVDYGSNHNIQNVSNHKWSLNRCRKKNCVELHVLHKQGVVYRKFVSGDTNDMYMFSPDKEL